MQKHTQLLLAFEEAIDLNDVHCKTTEKRSEELQKQRPTTNE